MNTLFKSFVKDSTLEPVWNYFKTFISPLPHHGANQEQHKYNHLTNASWPLEEPLRLPCNYPEHKLEVNLVSAFKGSYSPSGDAGMKGSMIPGESRLTTLFTEILCPMHACTWKRFSPISEVIAHFSRCLATQAAWCLETTYCMHIDSPHMCSRSNTLGVPCMHNLSVRDCPRF